MGDCEWSSARTAALLPQSFSVRHLGCRRSPGLSDFSATQAPLGDVIAEIRQGRQNIGPKILLTISKNGIRLSSEEKFSRGHISFAISGVGYGMQDSRRRRLFCVLVGGGGADRCHVFLCASPRDARDATRALAAAFHLYALTALPCVPKPHRDRQELLLRQVKTFILKMQV